MVSDYVINNVHKLPMERTADIERGVSIVVKGGKYKTFNAREDDCDGNPSAAPS
ncbi:hypothetical protein [Streptomyces sp. RLA2-12]|uniref:hypothetical protein n=1 Tax=Streptomyces sp. RLA2-12 TaxID=2721242 RepID=UPI00145C7215|nr:hypothetical protein [Streptomyces sp. RLA2-12]NMI63163.1 hypothetical protein [Streptomyces sp. RLA2-12]